jgi:AraC-like DNA-binding protein
MESFFFNITDTRYKVTKNFKKNDEHITRVDISNGVVFLDISLKSNQIFHIKNLDRMAMFCVVKNGKLNIDDNISHKKYTIKNQTIKIYISSRQDLIFNVDAESEIFILFVADFFLKRYLSSNINEPIDLLYNKMQDEISLELLNTQTLDALSLYLIEKIINIKPNTTMKSIRCEHNVIEFLIHRLSLYDITIQDATQEELDIAKKAKDILLQNFTKPPTINNLAHLCATNESKLKKVFKKVYKSTIYSYIQKIRLQNANILLKEQSLSIGEISKQIGYKHQGHFSKIYFQTYGIYPKDLLKNR